METRYITLSIRRLEAPEERMKREGKEIALRCIAGAVVALCVAAIALGWYAVVTNRAIIRESKAAAAEPVQVTSKLKIADAAMVSAEIEAQELASVQVKNAADLYAEESEDDFGDDNKIANPSPLTDEEWAALLEVCEERRIDPALALGLIQVESGFDGDAVAASGSGAYGYCQIVPKWHPAGLSHTENIRYGLNYLADLCEKYDSTDAGLTAYFWGYDNGTRDYADRVLETAEEWAKAEEWRSKTWND